MIVKFSDDLYVDASKISAMYIHSSEFNNPKEFCVIISTTEDGGYDAGKFLDGKAARHWLATIAHKWKEAIDAN